MKIKLSEVEKSYYQGNTAIEVLKSINMEVKSGEVVALLGKSGSGKSTILSLLSGLIKSDRGTLELDDVNLNNLSEDELSDFRSKKIGIIFQDFHLLPHLTALENVLLPLEINGRENKSLAEDWLLKVGLENRLNHFPSMLSGGEAQRVAIARALAFGPSLILADEPTGNLDNETGKKVIDVLFKIIRENKMTMVLVTHDEELAKLCDRIFYLKGGQCHF